MPVVFAALNYGLRGAVVHRRVGDPSRRGAIRARRSAITTTWPPGPSWPRSLLLDALAVLIGQRVTAEREARRIAEAAEEAHLSAEALYRDLFDSNQAPILIVDGNGNVVETNASARTGIRCGRGATG